MSGECNHYTILHDKTTTSKKFNMVFRTIHVLFNDNFRHVPALKMWTQVENVFKSLIKDLTKGIPETHKVLFILRSTQLKESVCLPFWPVKEITPGKVLSMLEHVLQTNTEFTFNDMVEIELKHVNTSER